VPVIALLDLQLKADLLETGLEVIHETLTATRGFAGCLGVSVLVDSKDPAHVVLSETWESVEHDRAYREWRAGAGAGASELSSFLAATPKLNVFTLAEGV
jgi:heme oxygenase (mycobilin-producing)